MKERKENCIKEASTKDKDCWERREGEWHKACKKTDGKPEGEEERKLLESVTSQENREKKRATLDSKKEKKLSFLVFSEGWIFAISNCAVGRHKLVLKSATIYLFVAYSHSLEHLNFQNSLLVWMWVPLRSIKQDIHILVFDSFWWPWKLLTEALKMLDVYSLPISE